MNRCAACGQENRIGLLCCVACGEKLAQPISQTTPVSPFHQHFLPTQAAPDADVSGRTLLVSTDHGLKAIVLPGAQRLILGRHDAGSATQPDIDLSPFAGLAAGVSRQHAALSFAELTATLTDLNSRNGTYLNGKRLPPSLPHIVSSGDEIRLGKLLIYLHL